MKRCQICGREDTKGFENHGRGFALSGSTRTAQRINMNSGSVRWECAKGIGCKG